MVVTKYKRKLPEVVSKKLIAYCHSKTDQTLPEQYVISSVESFAEIHIPMSEQWLKLVLYLYNSAGSLRYAIPVYTNTSTILRRPNGIAIGHKTPQMCVYGSLYLCSLQVPCLSKCSIRVNISARREILRRTPLVQRNFLQHLFTFSSSTFYKNALHSAQAPSTILARPTPSLQL
jgi:hypothetical protein